MVSMVYIFSQNWKKYVGAGINTLMSTSDGLGPSVFLSKGAKGAFYEGREGWKNCFFPARVGILTLMLRFVKYFSIFVP